MREIKFRAWDNINKRYLRHDMLDLSIKNINKNNSGKKQFFYEQFTGLYDCEGKEIYEGDIIFSDQWNPNSGEVIFDRGGFCIKHESIEYYADIKYAEQMKIIGNIHENPELLK